MGGAILALAGYETDTPHDLDQLLVQCRQRPVLYLYGQHQPPKEVVEVVRQCPICDPSDGGGSGSAECVSENTRKETGFGGRGAKTFQMIWR